MPKKEQIQRGVYQVQDSRQYWVKWTYKGDQKSRCTRSVSFKTAVYARFTDRMGSNCEEHSDHENIKFLVPHHMVTNRGAI